ncbi:hypothetical protein J2751_001415 [Halorubrum alkaliphilum]|uniref:DUF7260 domain-containing protein n=1 Tax=Halorubrum alkaliphilum TaxID=261290 RepID=A0A8T4GFA0_9EURY|nr:hypothetical protein [Halorubrum alkaliphilum]MBP1922407.1 hypothetical protein [Halorubrum alkaliphilum]
MAASDPSDPNDSESTDTGNESLSQPNGGVNKERSKAVEYGTILKPLREATESLDLERRRLVDECQAFKAFRSRINRIPTSKTPTTSTSSKTLQRQEQVPGTGLVAVRDAYRETVMGVPHYEAEYNDTYPQSLAAEFSPEVAVALTQGSVFTERYNRLLCAKTRESIEEREQFITAVDTERESLTRAADRLRSIAEELQTLGEPPLSDLDYGTLDAYRVRTETLESNCDAIARRRQREHAATSRSLQLDDTLPDVATYLYQDHSVTYPALATVGRLGDRLCDLRESIGREMMLRR